MPMVKDLVDSLTVRGNDPRLPGKCLQDLLGSNWLWTSPRFCKKEDQYKEGYIDIDLLMLQASNKYKTMFKARIWNAPLSEEE